MRYIACIVGFVLAATLVGAVGLILSPCGRIYAPSGTGIAAKQVCSITFVSGLEPERTRALYVDPLLGRFAPYVSVSVDRSNNQVRSSFPLGLFTQTAVYRNGLGCTLVHSPSSFDYALTAPLPPAEALSIDEEHRNLWFDDAALDNALNEGFRDDDRNTLGVVVLHQGRLVAERYADGVTNTTPLHGWSMTKSVIVTLAGVMTLREEIDVFAQRQVSTLADASDELSDITIDQLLRMTGGLAIAERNDGLDPNSDMLFTERDMAKFSATRGRLYSAGAHWDYQSGNTILATRALQDRLGRTAAEQVVGFRERVTQPLGVTTAVMELDETGTMVGSSYMFASAQDWALIGQSYIDNRKRNGEPYLPQDWRTYVGQETEGSNGKYGAGFWRAGRRLPPDTLEMSGFQGQWAFIVPSLDLVVVRLGATNYQNDGAREMTAAIIASMTPPGGTSRDLP